MTQDPVEIASLLRRQNADNSHQFESLFQVLSGEELLLNADDIKNWLRACYQLSDSGWQASQIVAIFLDYTAQILDQTEFHPSRLISVGKQAVLLSHTSSKPVEVYLKGIISALSLRQNSEDLESVGELISGRYKYASNLIAEYYETGFALLSELDTVQMVSWTKLCASLVESGRGPLVTLFEKSRRYTNLDWRLVSELCDRSPDYGFALISYLGEWQHRLAGCEANFATLLYRYANQGDQLLSWLEALERLMPSLSNGDFHALLRILQDVDAVTTALLLCPSASQLPLTDENIMNPWLAAGFEIAGQNAAAGEAFFRLESATSVDLLERLKGQVRLSDELRSLQLLTEGCLGKNHRGLRLVLLDKDTPRTEVHALDYAWGSDGLHVYLPDLVDVYPDRADNLRWLRVVLFHQLACYEYQTFSYEFMASDKPFAERFRQYETPGLAALIFGLLEHGRLDWRLQADYPGLSASIDWLKQAATYAPLERYQVSRLRCLAVLELVTLDLVTQLDSEDELSALNTLDDLLEPLRLAAATVTTTMAVCERVYDLITSVAPTADLLSEFKSAAYRGHIMFDDGFLNIKLAKADDPELALDEDTPSLSMSGMTDAQDVTVDELQQGDVNDGQSITLPEDAELSLEDVEPGAKEQGDKLGQKINIKDQARPVERVFQYDEWDHEISDYRRRWCTLFEIRELEEDADYVRDTMAEHWALANQVRRQLNNLRPELLQKVKGVNDGEELDIERAIESIVDKRAGVTPSDNIYVVRQRKTRDVSALFLLDMSASTDDVLPDAGVSPQTAPEVDYEDYFFAAGAVGPATDPGLRIIDLEKQAAILMAEALQGLGDSYAICGFSGYGRDKVEYYVCKDFQDSYDHRAKGRIGGIKPCRSTRMGPAIRHATKMLADTESRIKALIIISDGYPQDFDYGSDRNSRLYGVKDTTKALAEAQQAGVQSFCLTVDQSGHDYLREMCPDQQYMVIRDLAQLPSELSKIYRGLTS